MHRLKSNVLKTAILVPILFAIVMSVFGFGIGTYCWYEYQSYTNAKYGGTALAVGGKIDTGLISEQKLVDFAKEFDLIEDHTTIQGKYIYWAREGDPLESKIVMSYLSRLGYASNKITATSSTKFEDGRTFRLRNAPSYLTRAEFEYAPASSYTHLEIAFRTNIKSEIYLKSSSVTAGDSVREAVRIHFKEKRNLSTGFILNPSSLEDGKDAVGGLLNLNSSYDSYFDYNSDSEKEHIYGECVSVTYDGSRYEKETPIDPSKITCFNSNHKEGLLIPTIVPEYAYYHGTKTVNGVRGLTTTDKNTIGQLEMDIYLEGWDLSATEKIVSSYYSLNLEFSLREIV